MNDSNIFRFFALFFTMILLKVTRSYKNIKILVNTCVREARMVERGLVNQEEGRGGG